MFRQLNLTYGEAKFENYNPSRLTFNEKKDYFELLNHNEKNKLYNIYKQDFYLFDYDPDIFNWSEKNKGY